MPRYIVSTKPLTQPLINQWGGIQIRMETMKMSDADYYPNEYKKYKEEVKKLEDTGAGTTKEAGKIRAQLIALWNKMTPQQQKEIAIKYVSD